MNCVIYARVSTEQQADRELSIPAQIQAMREYAKRQGWNVVEEFIEPGVSGRTAQRPVLQSMLSRCREQPRIDAVLVHKIDRLARSVYDHAVIRYQLKQQGIKLASVVENIDDSVSGQLVENIMASIAQFYSANLGEEVKKGMRMLVEKGGWPHPPPRGYRSVRDEAGRGHIKPTDEARVVRYAYQRYATGLYSLRDVRDLLTEKGFLSSRGRPVPLAVAHRLLMNPFYAGRVSWKGVEYPGQHPAIVPEELFLRVQKVLRQRHRDCGEKGKLHFLMRGVAVCAECGSKMTAERHGRWSYYRCVKHTMGHLCAARFSNVAVAHHSLENLYRRLHLSDSLKERLEAEGRRLVAERTHGREQRLRSLRMKQSKLEERELKITEAFASGELSATAYRAVLSKLRGQHTMMGQAITEVDADPQVLLDKLIRVLEFAASLHDLRSQLPEQGQSRLLRTLFKRVTLDQGKIVDYALHPPFDRLLFEAGRNGSSRRDLEDHQVTPTISSILEFDCSRLDNLLDRRQAA